LSNEMNDKRSHPPAASLGRQLIGKLRQTLRYGFGRQGILLVTAPPWSIHNPPLGLAYLSEFLRVHGIAVDVLDLNIHLYRRSDPEWHKLWLPEYKNDWCDPSRFPAVLRRFTGDLDWAVLQILRFKRPVVGFSVVDPKERITIEIIRRLRRADPTMRVILGGPAVSTAEQRDIFKIQLGESVDCCVVGEGEEALRELMLHYERRGHSALYRESHDRPRIVQKPVSKIDDVPFPKYEGFDFSQYEGGGLFVEWSRGCIGSCTYCKGGNLLGPYRMKRAGAIVAEIDWNLNNRGISHFIVCDNLLNGNPSELHKLCDLLVSTRIPATWEGQGVPHKGMSQKILDRMKQAGCTTIQWGVETGSDKVRGLAGKGRMFTTVEAERVLQASHHSGIRNEIFFMIGLPGEDEVEFSHTLDFISRNRKYIDSIKSVNTLHLIHGTELKEHPDRHGLYLPETDWHYKWRDGGSNNYEMRVDRARRLISYAESHGLKVLENNLHEGIEPESVRLDRAR